MGKFGAAAEAAMVRIEMLQDGVGELANEPRRPSTPGSCGEFSLLDGSEESAGGFFDFVPASAERFGDTFEDTTEAGASHGVLRREVGSAIKRTAVGKQEAGEWPASLAG